MIFTGFKRKSNQLFFNNRLQELLDSSNKEATNKVKNAIVFLDDYSSRNKILNNLVALIPVLEVNVELFIFSQKIIKEGNIEEIFTPKDFGWYGRIKSEKLKHILTKKYDLLINYSEIDNLYSNLLLLQCKADFRVGFGHLDNRFYDLIIDCDHTDIIAFNKELKKYLQILNKI